MVEGPLQHSKHVFRVVILLFALVITLVLGRGFFVPESWGEYGWYRAAAVADHRAPKARHHGNSACEKCHDEQASRRTEGAHNTVTCELCHSVYSDHIVDDEVVAEMQVPESVELCSKCHRALNARPKGFPQVNIKQHLSDLDVDLESNICVACHDPHSPADI